MDLRKNHEGDGTPALTDATEASGARTTELAAGCGSAYVGGALNVTNAAATTGARAATVIDCATFVNSALRRS